MSTAELPGERSARIVKEMREQDAKDEEVAREALRRFCILGGAVDGFPEAEEKAYLIGYKDRMRDERKVAPSLYLAVYDLGYDGSTVLGVAASQQGAMTLCEEHNTKQAGHWPNTKPALVWKIPATTVDSSKPIGETAPEVDCLVADLSPQTGYYTEKWTVVP